MPAPREAPTSYRPTRSFARSCARHSRLSAPTGSLFHQAYARVGQYLDDLASTTEPGRASLLKYQYAESLLNAIHAATGHASRSLRGSNTRGDSAHASGLSNDTRRRLQDFRSCRATLRRDLVDLIDDLRTATQHRSVPQSYWPVRLAPYGNVRTDQTLDPHLSYAVTLYEGLQAWYMARGMAQLSSGLPVLEAEPTYERITDLHARLRRVSRDRDNSEDALQRLTAALETDSDRLLSRRIRARRSGERSVEHGASEGVTSPSPGEASLQA